MTDPTNHRESKGVSAYRWWLSVGMSATLALVGLILTTVKETANDVTLLKVQVSAMAATQLHQSARIDAIERRNDAQDTSIIDLQRRVWRLPERGVP